MPAVVAPVVTWVSTTLAAGGLGAVLLRMGGTLLLSAAARALMPRPQAGLGTRTISGTGPILPCDLVYGRARKGGVRIFTHVTGNKDQFLHLVLVLACHPVQGIGAIRFDGEEAISAEGIVQGRWAGKITLEKRLGAADQSAFAGLMSAAPTKWTAAHRLAGHAAIHLRLTWDADAFAGGLPNITVDIEGKNDILDPRTGTRGYTENAALCLADYMAHAEFGIGAAIGAPDGLDTDSLIEAANICDEDVDVPGGGTETRYACNGVISLGEAPETIIKALLTAMAGRAACSGGVWRLLAGAWRPPDVALSERDVAERGLVLATRVSMAENFNAVRGVFVAPQNDWQPDDFAPHASAVYLAEDGERRWHDIALPFTISASAAQRIARIELERMRRQMSVTLSGKLTAWAARAGDVVAFSHARWGMSAKPFEVLATTLELGSDASGAPAILPQLVLRETAPLVYDWNASEAQIHAAAPRSTLPSATDIPAPGTPALSEALYETRAGSGVRVLIDAAWIAAPSAFVRDYQLRARRMAQPDGTATGEAWQVIGRTDQLSWQIRDVQPGFWEVGVKAVTVLGVSSDYATGGIEVLGLTAPPGVIEGLTIQTAGGLAILKWQPSSDLDVRIGGRIVIRHCAAEPPSWSSSTSMDQVAGADALAVVPLKPGTYLVRARDNSGNIGPVAMATTSGAQAVGFAPVDSLVAEPDWPGTLDNLSASGAGLTLSNTTAPGLYTWSAGLDLGAVHPVRLRSDIAMAAVNLASTIDARIGAIDTWPDFDDAEGAEVDVIVEIRTTQDDPAASPAWSDWTRLDATEAQIRALQARARLRSASPDHNILLTRLRVHADEVF